jgi:DNA-directed RNA polymerase subunit M/transcription elongation factor TFIIS
MEIIKRGTPKDKSYQVVCKDCESEIRFQYKEAKKHHHDDGITVYITCPVCGGEVYTEDV